MNNAVLFGIIGAVIVGVIIASVSLTSQENSEVTIEETPEVEEIVEETPEVEEKKGREISVELSEELSMQN